MSLKSLQQFSCGIVLYVLDGKVFCSLQSSEICRISCIKSLYSLCFNAQKVEKEKAAVDLVFFGFVCVCDFHHFSCLLLLHICINVKKLHRVVLVLHVVVVDNLIHLTSRPVVIRHLKLGSTFSENLHCCIYVCMYTVGHKKRATLFWTLTSAFFDGFEHFVYQRKKEQIFYTMVYLFSGSSSVMMS